MRLRLGHDFVILGCAKKLLAAERTRYMTQMHFTKAQEREEARLLKKGFMHSCISLLLCWLPVVGLLLSISGFWRVFVRLTQKHRVKRAACLVFAFLCLVACTGVLLGEVWVYSRDPEIISRTGGQIWTFMVGEENAGVISDGGTVYPDMNSAGMGLYGEEYDAWAEDEFWTGDGGWEEDASWEEDEDISAWADDFDWEAWENDTWGEDGSFFPEGEEFSDEDILGVSSTTKESALLGIGKGETIYPPVE